MQDRQNPAGGEERDVIVVSDLHLGGRPKTATSPSFQMMTHSVELASLFHECADRDPATNRYEVVLNGDLIDFLAEEDPVPADPRRPWSAFRGDATQAEATLQEVMVREAAVFDALERLVHRGHTLTLLLGNHDLELCLPALRAAFARRLRLPEGQGLRFFYDGEAYVVGDTLIEHGNRYDRFNQVDHDGLRQLRSTQSRRQQEDWQELFAPPVGSVIVAEIMNRFKQDFPFVDLLKPEQETVLPLLLALSPDAADYIDQLLWVMRTAVRAGVQKGHPARPVRRSNIASDSDGTQQPLALGPVLSSLFAGRDEYETFVELLSTSPSPPWAATSAVRARPVADSSENRRWDQALDELRHRLALAKIYLHPSMDGRMKALLSALRILRNDRSFDRSYEQPSYLQAAQRLARDGVFRHVLFGHTHLAKEKVPLQNGALYYNSGTFCNLMRVPEIILCGAEKEALRALRLWVESLTDPERRGGEWIGFDLSYLSFHVNKDGQTSCPQLKSRGCYWPS